MRTTILLAGESTEQLARFVARLEELGHRVTSAPSGERCLELLARERPDVLVIDAPLPDVAGTELLRRVRRSPQHDVPVILVSDRQDEIDRVIAFELGTDDFVTKPFSARELALRVAAVLRRARRTNGKSQDRLELGPLTIDVPRHEVTVDGQVVSLTALEFRLLLDLAKRRGRVQRRDELLERVWRYPGELETRTVDTHVKRLREKLGIAGDYIETVRGVGYRMRDGAA